MTGNLSAGVVALLLFVELSVFGRSYDVITKSIQQPAPT